MGKKRANCIVLHIIATSSNGGTERTALRLADGLRREYGVENHFAILRAGDGSILPELTQLTKSPPTYLEFDLGRTRAAIRFAKLIQSLGTTDLAIIFHSFNISVAILSLIARLVGGKAMVAKAGNPAPQKKDNPTKRRTYHLALVIATLAAMPIVASSHWIMRTLTNVGPLPPRSRVIHNGVEVEAIAERARSMRHMRRGDTYIVGMVSRFDVIKDHDTLLRTLSQLPANVRLRLIGDGPTLGRSLQLAEQLKVDDRVEFLRSRNDVPEQLGLMDIFVMSTTSQEGFGIAVVEALAAGVPVIATDVPACREVLRNGELGVLVPEKNVVELAAAIRVQGRSTAEQMEIRSKVIERYYGKEQMTSAYCQLLGLEPRDQT